MGMIQALIFFKMKILDKDMCIRKRWLFEGYYAFHFYYMLWKKALEMNAK